MSKLMTFLFIAFGITLLLPLVVRANVCEERLTLPNPFFYELKRDGHISYALGTIHYGVSIQALPSEIIGVILHDCTDFVFELPRVTGVQGGPQFRMWWATHSLVPGMLRLKLSEAHWTELATRLHKNNISPTRTYTLTPLSALMLSDRSVRARRDAIDQVQMDEELKNILSWGKVRPMHAFESPKEQLDLLSQIATMARLRAELDAPEDTSLPFADSLRNYIDGDEVAQIGELERLFQIDPNAYKLMILDRNQRWKSIVIGRHAYPGRHLFVAGLNHWLGDGGLLNLLGREGFEIRRMK